MTRAERMSALALADASELDGIWEGVAERPEFNWIRPPEYASVLVRGKVCTDGRAFNIGEAVVTRCVLQLADNDTIGVACVIGRRRRHATLAALLDAISQSDSALGQRARTAIVELGQARLRRKAAVAATVAATAVDFSMLLRAEAS